MSKTLRVHSFSDPNSLPSDQEECQRANWSQNLAFILSERVNQGELFVLYVIERLRLGKRRVQLVHTAALQMGSGSKAFWEPA
ncbi:hypothetical protein BaRGS_00004245 [Batillaria attramentaria]|uniref:Uncharacterized protein n=1 Tax=Batillaria attramentaria TaxID=370345 RepID=A0ABD0LXK0_9CAEN